MRLLWTNPTPYSASPTAFLAQTINIDLSGYDGVIIEGAYSTDHSKDAMPTDRRTIFYLEKGWSANPNYGMYNTSNDLWVTFRPTTISNNSVAFGSGSYKSPGQPAGVTNNNVAIPIHIWGVKNAIEYLT